MPPFHSKFFISTCTEIFFSLRFFILFFFVLISWNSRFPYDLNWRKCRQKLKQNKNKPPEMSRFFSHSAQSLKLEHIQKTSSFEWVFFFCCLSDILIKLEACFAVGENINFFFFFIFYELYFKFCKINFRINIYKLPSIKLFSKRWLLLIDVAMTYIEGNRGVHRSLNAFLWRLTFQLSTWKIYLKKL